MKSARPTRALVSSFVILVSSFARAQLPIHIEEYHAGSFYHFVETLPFDQPHTLVLIDAHSDANAIANSDAIRAAIRRGPTRDKRSEMLAQWRKEGRIQCFDWIEPLMPAPIAEVIWIPAVHLEENDRAALEKDARDYLDAHEEALPRDAGPLATHYRVLDLETFEQQAKNWPEERRIVASIDLDFFAKLKDEDLASGLERLMDTLMPMRALRSLSFALSSPYLRDAVQAERLLTLALDAAWRIPNAEVHFDPFARTGPDRSLMARLLERQGKQIPAFDISTAGPELRTLLLEHWKSPQADKLLAAWAGSPFQHRIEIPGQLKMPNGSWELEFSAQKRLCINPAPVGARVRWIALRAADTRYRIGEANLGFASEAPRWMWQKRHVIAEGPALSEIILAQLTSGDCGTSEIFAEIIRDGEITRTPHEIIRLSKPDTQGVRAEWTRQFGLPYVFDSRLLTRGTRSGAEAFHGADCANFITAALRAEGWLLPWGSPADVKPFFTETTQLEEPALLHFGSHLAAVWEDKAPLGQLNDEDLCIHQLEGPPEILPFAKLRQNRRKPQLMTIREPAEKIRIVIGGDIMPGHGLAAKNNPLAPLQPFFEKADLALGNLECVLSDEKAAKRHQLIAPLKTAALLRQTGFHGLSLANNHANDLGREGHEMTQKALEAEKIIPLGPQAKIFELRGKRIAVIAFDDSREEAVLPEITVTADFVILLPHWGREHQSTPTPRQRQFAAQLLQNGAHLIVGSGPHCLQPLETSLGRVVAYSLGNTLFDGPGPDAEWDRGAVLEVILDANTCRIVRARTHILRSH